MDLKVLNIVSTISILSAHMEAKVVNVVLLTDLPADTDPAGLGKWRERDSTYFYSFSGHYRGDLPETSSAANPVMVPISTMPVATPATIFFLLPLIHNTAGMRCGTALKGIEMELLFRWTCTSVLMNFKRVAWWKSELSNQPMSLST